MPELRPEETPSFSALFSLTALDPSAHVATGGAGRGGVSRRAVIGAAWAAPVVVAAVAAPLASASTGQPDAQLYWSEAEGVQGQSSLLTLLVPNGSPGIGSTATIVLTVSENGPIPGTISSGRWTYTPDFGASTGILASPTAGVTAGTRGFTVDEWGDRSGPYTVVATYTNDKEPGSLTAAITIGFGPEPTLEWIPNPAEFSTTATLRLTVPQYSYAIGQRGVIADLNQFPPPFQTPPFPAGTTVTPAADWAPEIDPSSGMTGYVMDPVAQGVYDFEYALGAGTTEVTPGVLLGVGAGIPKQAPLRIVPA
ncbi:hypothetical protein [Herbiconiux sp. A18JL235]|uniref:Uncharacterized protein n=1 Tax=Herbiconiux sp. A18JL235 TaxID=3152363 RepID=A0AB39BDU8_9MICO